MADTNRWGILGCGRISGRFSEGLAMVPGNKLVAVACRSEKKGHDFAERFGVAAEGVYTGEAFGGDTDKAYRELLKRPDIDAVYIALPNTLHYPWTIEALKVGKDVLCEKPAFLSADDATEVKAFAQSHGRLFMEAIKSRFTPCYREVKQAVESGEIGTITDVDVCFCCNIWQSMLEVKNFRCAPTQKGGGALLDCGTYCASLINDFVPQGKLSFETFSGIVKTAQNPAAPTGIFAPDGERVDIYTDVRFKRAGIPAHLECGYDREKPCTAVLNGTRGSIIIDNMHRAAHATIKEDDGEDRILYYPMRSEGADFSYEIAHFCDLKKQGIKESPIMSLSATAEDATLLHQVWQRFSTKSENLKVLERQEHDLVYKQFGSHEALELGDAVAYFARHAERGIGVQITRESDGLVLFQWMDDDKAVRNLGFMQTKREAVLKTGHSSLWACLSQGTTDAIPVAGGAFPIRVASSDGSAPKQVATLSISGLHEGRDHELCVRSLAWVLSKRYGGDGFDGRVPAFLGVSI